MISTEQAIEAIEKRLILIESISSVEQFNNWQTTTVLTLSSIYGENDKRVKKLEDIEAYRFYAVSGIERVPEAKREASSILDGLINDLKDFGIPKPKEAANKGVNVSVNQHNHQNQTTNVNINLELFIEAIKDELKGGQVKELKTILESNLEPEEKKRSFSEKIKSFGSDVASNILANILTNPQVYEQIGMLF